MLRACARIPPTRWRRTVYTRPLLHQPVYVRKMSEQPNLHKDPVTGDMVSKSYVRFYRAGQYIVIDVFIVS